MAVWPYNTASWQRLRGAKPSTSPLCEACLQRGRPVSAQAVDHVVSIAKGGEPFTVEPDGEAWRGDKRELRSVKLYEVSIVNAWPAYSGTSVQARSRQSRTAADRRLARLNLEARNVAV